MADGPKFTGFVTGSYIYDLNDPVDGFVNGAGIEPGTGYSNFYGGRNASFKADAAHLTITGGDSAGASYTIDLDAGTDGMATGGAMVSKTGFAFDVQQAFVSIPFGKSPLGLQAGKFYTSEGIEVGNSGANPTLTRGLAFGVLEFTSSTGAVITFKANDQISGAIGAVSNPNGQVWQYDGSDGIPVGYAKVALAYGDPFAATISAYYGPQGGFDTSGMAIRKMYTSLDLTGLNKTLVPNLDLNFQGNFMWKDKSTMGAAYTAYLLGLQPLYHMGAAQIGLRYEFLSQDQGSSWTINSIALAPGYKLTQNSLLRVEYRIDLASEKVFGDDKGMMDTKTDQVIGSEINYTF
ncbi:MAG TPA: outer membrane beta-barrel protein [Fibrobacteria bacterium]|nr:outer membrane beta-barrel protein [Fibrobacteria bacterium]